LIHIRKLKLSVCDKLTSLSGIECLTQLKELSLSSCSSLTSLAGIESLTHLKEIDLSSCSSLTSLAGIKPLTQIENLYSYTASSSIQPLITEMLIACGKIKSEDIDESEFDTDIPF
jgi:Leucine-rich repeat (LRR) protein